jgi:DNA replication protein DnaC
MHAAADQCPACEPLSNCSVCGGSGFSFERDWTGQAVSRPCLACGDLKLRVRLFDEAAIPRNFYQASLDDFARGERSLRDAATDLRGLLRDFQPGDKGVCFGGHPGIGKTHLLCALLRTLTLERGIRARYVEFAHLLSDLRAGFDRGVGEAELLGDLTSVPVLVVDELGKKSVTDWQVGILDELVTRRYNREVSTFFATNLWADDGSAPPAGGDIVSRRTLAQELTPRIFSRVCAMATYRRLDGPDRRRG